MPHSVQDHLRHRPLAIGALGRGFVINRLREAFERAVAAGFVSLQLELLGRRVGRGVERTLLVFLNRLLRSQRLHQIQRCNRRLLLRRSTRHLANAVEVDSAVDVGEKARGQQAECDDREHANGPPLGGRPPWSFGREMDRHRAARLRTSVGN